MIWSERDTVTGHSQIDREVGLGNGGRGAAAKTSSRRKEVSALKKKSVACRQTEVKRGGGRGKGGERRGRTKRG